MPQAGYNGPNSAQLPLIAVISASQAGLAAGAEVLLNIPLPLNLVLPPAANLPGPPLPLLCSVVATDTPNAALVATPNLNGGQGTNFQARVRNVGTVASGAYFVVGLFLGANGAIGL